MLYRQSEPPVVRFSQKIGVFFVEAQNPSAYMVSSDADTFLGFAIVAKPSVEGFVEKYFGVFSTFSPNMIPQEATKINEKYMKPMEVSIVVVCWNASKKLCKLYNDFMFNDLVICFVKNWSNSCPDP